MTGRYPDGDFYGFEKDLPAEELKILHKVREWTHEKVRPIATDYWNRSEFPHELLPSCLLYTSPSPRD